VRLTAAVNRKEMTVKRFIAAVSFALLAGSAFAAEHSGEFVRSPLDRPPPGIRDPLEVRDPLMRPPSGGASLPDLGSSDASRMFEDMQPRPLPGEPAPPVSDPFLERSERLGPRPYWENDPLFIAPPL
jgi:hypothetical protein